jgi:tetratricopeptide (TPR) repeat protein
MSSLYSSADSIKKYVEKADLVSDAIGYQQGMAQVLRIYAGLDFQKKNYVSALEKAKKAESTYQKLNYKTRLSATLNQISNIYNTMGDFSTALDYNLKAMAVLSDNKSHSIYRNAKNTAATRYRALERHRKSLSMFLELIDESLTHGDSTNFSNGLFHASWAYRKLGILDSAVIYSRKVLALDIELNNHNFILSDYSLIGDTFFEMGEVDSALFMYERTEKIIDEDKELSTNQKNSFTTKNQIDMGMVYLKQRHMNNPYRFLKTGWP